jgi:hypothetical protein
MSLASSLLGGMPTIQLTDLARFRLQGISFFLAAFLLSGWLVQCLWNYLARDFRVLPRLTYTRSLGFVTLWSLAFVLVLTMISGARELMTPGAWEKQGVTYRVKEAAQVSDEQKLDRRRRDHLDRLRTALWTYAESHNGQFPPSRDDLKTTTDIWRTPDASGMRYLYAPGESPGRGARPLVYEPDIFGPRRLVLLSSGDVRELRPNELDPPPSGGAQK